MVFKPESYTKINWSVGLDLFGATLWQLPCLGFLPGSNCPHYEGETEQRPAFHRLLEETKIGRGLTADDGVALHFSSIMLGFSASQNAPQ